MTSPTSILVVRPGALGDAVLTLPLIDALVGGGARRVAVLGTPASWGFLAPGALEIHDLGSRDWLALFGGSAPLSATAREALRRCDGAVLCLTAERPAVETTLRAAGISRIESVSPVRADLAAPEHVAHRLLAALPALGLVESATPPVHGVAEDTLLRVAPEEISGARRSLMPSIGPDEMILVLHPGSGGAPKCWPAERFAALAQAAPGLGLRPVLLLGPADAAVGERVRQALPSDSAMPLVADRPLRQVLALLASARAYVGNDSGITHLAARATATLAIFGPTDPRLWRPLGPKVTVLVAPGGRLADLPVDAVRRGLAALLKV